MVKTEQSVSAAAIVALRKDVKVIWDKMVKMAYARDQGGAWDGSLTAAEDDEEMWADLGFCAPCWSSRAPRSDIPTIVSIDDGGCHDSISDICEYRHHGVKQKLELEERSEDTSMIHDRETEVLKQWLTAHYPEMKNTELPPGLPPVVYRTRNANRRTAASNKESTPMIVEEEKNCEECALPHMMDASKDGAIKAYRRYEYI